MAPSSGFGGDDDREMFVVEGVISELHVELGTQNLLSRIDNHYKRAATLTGAGALAGDLFGQAASAASLTMYDGEDTQNFLCLVDGQVICGQFGGAEWLRNGHRVKAVVERREGVLYAHGIMDEAGGLVWVLHPWGIEAEALANWRIAWWGYLFVLFCWSLAYFAVGGNMSFLESLTYAAACGAVVCFGVALWANNDMRGLAGPATEIFRLLGLANPQAVNLNNYRISVVAISDHLKDVNAPKHAALDKSSFQTRDVYCYQRAIAEGRLALAET